MKYYLVILLFFSIYAPPKKDLSIVVPTCKAQAPRERDLPEKMVIVVPAEPYKDFFTDFDTVLKIIEQKEAQSSKYIERFIEIYAIDSRLSHCLEQFKITSYIYKNAEASAYFVLNAIEKHENKSVELIQNFLLSYPHLAAHYMITFRYHAIQHNNFEVLGYFGRFVSKPRKRIRTLPKSSRPLQIPNQF
ncbi:hypothetical protein A3F66_02505 [candidate division TM6 bacterium RIFCSPHIGHO2_12_FULL_32_22]|nr:MAG: hypothetical protein A3F66_02505 [candidate division TM6 bacterium RIFCSPHIGHO2_12_FULL_32_22]